ncbi:MULTISPECIES: ABC transporter ATP-binding protein [unclassified Petrotoga]|uniref:ABC transporter ATP-binding protein n=1 Tax=Petrotoga sp. HWH.PT.55.6.1 TaxID=1307425 RepID=UPI002100AA84|nr:MULTISPECIES: ABC transporter ATP-binding protein [unclassified Petrotoga]
MKTQNLTKVFKVKKKEIRAIQDINLSIQNGDIFVLLGPNGAGKTTFLKTISTLILPTYGDAWVNGYNIKKDEYKVRKSIGLSTGFERSFYYRLNGYQNLEFFGTLYGIKSKDLKERINFLLNLFNLEDAKDLKYMKYSTGMKKKLSLARALLHDPDVYIFDEPTSSIDPISANEIRDIILSLKDKNKTIILSTHDMHEAELLADRIGILNKGNMLAVDKKENLKRVLKKEIIKVKVDKAISEDLISQDGIKEKINLFRRIKDNEFEIEVENSAEVLDQLIEKLKSQDRKILTINVEIPSIEEVFINFVRNDKK